MNLEIQGTVRLAFFISALLSAISLIVGIRQIRKANKLLYFKKRRDLILGGWRLIFGGLLLAGLAAFLNTKAEPVIYAFFKPSASPTLTASITPTPTITLTPSITEIPSITPTLSESLTPTITSTPGVPPAIVVSFESQITPDPNSVFSPLQFAKSIDVNYQPIDPDVSFKNPIKHIYGLFSFDGMTNGSQWTALWYRDGEMVYYETKAWDGGTGGYGFTDWAPDPSAWLPGNYEVQIFNGEAWKISGQFIVTGNAPTAAPTATNTFTPSNTASITPTRTSVPTKTIRPTKTTAPSATIKPTKTTAPTATIKSTKTSVPTATPKPTRTSSPTTAATATRTPTATNTPTPSQTPTAAG